MLRRSRRKMPMHVDAMPARKPGATPSSGYRLKAIDSIIGNTINQAFVLESISPIIGRDDWDITCHRGAILSGGPGSMQEFGALVRQRRPATAVRSGPVERSEAAMAL